MERFVGLISNLQIQHYHVGQRGPNTGTRTASGPRTVFVRPANAFCMPCITQSHKCIVLTIQP